MSPPRIVSLLSSATEILCALGLEESLLAVSHECDFPPSITLRPRATVSHIDSSRTSLQIDAEVKRRLGAGLALYGLNEQLLRRLAPDLIVTQAQCDVCAIRYDDVLRLVTSSPQLSHTKVLALSPTSLDDILQDVLRMGDAVGMLPQARRYAGSLRQRIKHVSTLTNSLDPPRPPRVICIEWVSPLMTAGNWTPELIELAGGQSGLATPRQHSGYVSWQQIVDFDPQILLVAPCGFDLPRSEREAMELTSLPGWSASPRCKPAASLPWTATLSSTAAARGSSIAWSCSRIFCIPTCSPRGAVCWRKEVPGVHWLSQGLGGFFLPADEND